MEDKLIRLEEHNRVLLKAISNNIEHYRIIRLTMFLSAIPLTFIKFMADIDDIDGVLTITWFVIPSTLTTKLCLDEWENLGEARVDHEELVHNVK